MADRCNDPRNCAWCGSEAHPTPEYFSQPRWTVKCSTCNHIGPTCDTIKESVDGWDQIIEAQAHKQAPPTCPTCKRPLDKDANE